MVRDLIEKAILILGSQAKLAEACGVKQPSIWQAKATERCSAELAMGIQRATSGQVLAAELRPDLPWPAAEITQSEPEGHPEVASGAA